ncbi:EamA family transporter [Patescibacteria group bacterium]|nr:EamA family transporter [Patescibacteria group bacterium]MBU4458336.1 EamA family transporter [Patescibacteria group bacterium]MCG2695909.1 EamA family transporter [Candidatus Portnoybacteria bacterium]
MSWILLVILAQFFYALVFILDKYILSRSMPHQVVYSFYVGVLGIFVLVLIPFGFVMPNGAEVFWSLIAGVAQISAFLFFYKAVNREEISRVVPFVGAASSVFVLILSSCIIKEFLTFQQIIAFLLLVLGCLVVGFRKKHFMGNGVLGLSIVSAFFFALFWVITKYLFLGTNFVSGLIWVRVGVALIALTLLFLKKNRELIFSETKQVKSKTTKFFILGRTLNVAGSLFLYLAVFLGSVTLTTAFQGLQYVFVLILALLLLKKIPVLKEQFNKEVLIQKIVAIIFICIGLSLLVI